MYALLFGVFLLVLYWVWIGLFFHRVRPWIMNWIGGGLGVRVAESTDLLDAGTYDVKGARRRIGKSVAVMAADLVVLLAGTVGVAALIFVPTFIAAERGWLLPIEGKLTGRSASLQIVGFSVSPGGGKGAFSLVAANTGEVPLTNCVVAVDSYSARTGYMHGASVAFDLAVGSPRTIPLNVEALRPPQPGAGFRLELECGAERMAVAEGSMPLR